MRIIQLIDSLEPGGAERMAVNYANSLVDTIAFSGLVATRKEGALLNQINPKVSYLFLNKKKALDLTALFRLKKFVETNKVTHIHAHSSSFFLAFLLKMLKPSLKIIRHDHYGNNEFLDSRPHRVLKFTASFFSGVIVVNKRLKDWSEQVLQAKEVIYLPNFAIKESFLGSPTVLEGFESKKIVCLANLRPQKNHFLLIKVALALKKTHPDWSFHLVGKDFEDEYSLQIKKLIAEQQLQSTVFVYGSRQDVDLLLAQASIAILTSASEGLPVALLEYGLSKKAVVVTNVGAVGLIVENDKNGFIVQSNAVDLFYNALVRLIENESLRKSFGHSLFNTIQADYSSSAVLTKYIRWMQKL